MLTFIPLFYFGTLMASFPGVLDAVKLQIGEKISFDVPNRLLESVVRNEAQDTGTELIVGRICLRKCHRCTPNITLIRTPVPFDRIDQACRAFGQVPLNLTLLNLSDVIIALQRCLGFGSSAFLGSILGNNFDGQNIQFKLGATNEQFTVNITSGVVAPLPVLCTGPGIRCHKELQEDHCK